MEYRGAWCATVLGVSKSRMWLSIWTATNDIGIGMGSLRKGKALLLQMRVKVQKKGMQNIWEGWLCKDVVIHLFIQQWCFAYPLFGLTARTASCFIDNGWEVVHHRAFRQTWVRESLKKQTQAGFHGSRRACDDRDWRREGGRQQVFSRKLLEELTN